MTGGIGVIIWGAIILLGLLIAGVPVFAAFLAVNLIGLVVLFGPHSYGILINSISSSTTSEVLVTVPLFLLMGEMLFRSGAVRVLFDAVDVLLGRLWGRQYFLTMLLSTIFGALSGSAVAVAALLGRTVMPTMLGRGYDARTSMGTILAGASLAPIIPPSILVILLGSMANVSVARLMVAGIVPGLLIAALCCVYIVVRGRIDPTLAPDEIVSGDQTSARQESVLRALLNMVPFMTIVGTVIGFMLAGIATPTESAAIGVVGAIAVAALYRKLSLEMISGALTSTVKISGMLIIILACSQVLGQLLAYTGATQSLIKLVLAMDLPVGLMVLVMLLIPFVLCMFLDQIALMLILVPVYVPILAVSGIDPIWFWTMSLVILTVGSITPPFGYTLFALKGAGDGVDIKDLYRASVPFVMIFLLGVFLLYLVPALVTFVPSLL